MSPSKDEVSARVRGSSELDQAINSLDDLYICCRDVRVQTSWHSMDPALLGLSMGGWIRACYREAGAEIMGP